ncbi:MAG: hypothetical protein Q8Q13_01520 [bacterium]|nr:hypothetical protein [bacterium]
MAVNNREFPMLVYVGRLFESLKISYVALYVLMIAASWEATVYQTNRFGLVLGSTIALALVTIMLRKFSGLSLLGSVFIAAGIQIAVLLSIAFLVFGDALLSIASAIVAVEYYICFSRLMRRSDLEKD